MDRQGRVRKLYEDGTALVICNYSCAMSCDQCGSCRRTEEGVIARNPSGAAPGELVLIRTRPGKMLLAAWMLLLQPVVSFFVMYWLGSAFNAGKIAGCIAFGVSVCIGVIYDRCAASKPGSGYTVIRYPQNINKRG